MIKLNLLNGLEDKWATKRAWRMANRDKVRAAKRAWRLANPEKVKAMKAASYLRHRDSVLEKNRQYLKDHPEVRRTRDTRKRDILNAQRREWAKRNPERTKEFARRSYLKRKEEHNSKCKAYYEANKPAVLAMCKKWALENREKVRAAKKKYKANNPDKDLAHVNLRRARKAMAYTDGTAAAFYSFVRSKKSIACYYCGRMMSGKKAHIDHIVAISKGGNHTSQNLCASCPECNLTKNNKSVREFNPELKQYLLEV